MCFGGGGWFAAELATDGYVGIDAGLEFGGQFGMDVGVASGSVYVRGGIYLQVVRTDDRTDVTLGGCITLGGELDVLGIISVSLTFDLTLEYRIRNGADKMWGRASLVVEVDVLVFSGSVEIEVERTFGNSDADPSFADAFTTDDWASYCDAFDEIEAVA
jgi:hypothetical protein